MQGEEKELLLALVRKVLRWLPEDRPSAEGLFEDGFLNQFRATRLGEVESTRNRKAQD